MYTCGKGTVSKLYCCLADKLRTCRHPKNDVQVTWPLGAVAASRLSAQQPNHKGPAAQHSLGKREKYMQFHLSILYLF